MLNYEEIITGMLFIPAAYMWRSLYKTYLALNKEYKDEELFYERHNCVVMYSRGCMRGWPPEYNFKCDKTNLNNLLEPYLYFISTAKYSIDIAMMRITINPLIDALHAAVERGVKIRLIVNFLSVKSVKEKYQNLMKAGVKIQFYVDKSDKLNQIMHCKYMIKDIDTNNGYLCMGSLNFTSLSTMLSNFEDVTFTSNLGVVGAFHKSFEESWDMISRDNTNLYNKTVLSECGFLE